MPARNLPSALCTESHSSFRPLRANSSPGAATRSCATSSTAPASLIVLNIAEGCGRRSPADKGRFYSMARGSATECAAILDLLAARRVVDDRLRNRARALLVRTVQMLTQLGARMAATSVSQRK